MFWWLYAADFIWFSVDVLVFVLGGGIESYKEVSVQYYKPKEIKEETLQQAVDNALAKYDKDGDSELSREEMKELTTIVLDRLFGKKYTIPKEDDGQYSEDLYNQTFDKFDLNMDNKISRDELVPFIRSLLESGYEGL